MNVDTQYTALVERLLSGGEMLPTRNGNRLTVYGHQMRFNLADGFPILTTKYVWWKGITEELAWFLRGSTNVTELQERGVHIWDANSLPDGTIGPGYGYQWRNFNGDGIDQISKLVNDLKRNPTSTRMVVLAWNPNVLKSVGLPPCHFAFQAHSNGRELTLQVSMRSSDVALCLPFNIASYALLTHVLGQVTGLIPKELIMDLGNIHLYQDHIEPIKTQLKREPYPLPRLHIRGEVDRDLRHINPDNMVLAGYHHHPTVKMRLIA